MFADISRSIDPVIARCLVDLSQITAQAGLEFMVIGATARDFVYRHVYGIEAPRATQDVDLGIRVESWDKLAELRSALCEAGSFVENGRIRHRIIHKSGIPVDLIPFGGLESPPGVIAWPPDGSPVMSTLGFAEAFGHSIDLKIGGEADPVIRLATPPAIVCLKLIAWNDRPWERASDAEDIIFLARHYGDAGNESLLLNGTDAGEPDENYDYEIASATLLGRHIRKIATYETVKAVRNILEKVVDEGEYSAFVRDSIGRRFDEESRALKHFQLLKAIHAGLNS
jgi:predicted nucleotidyltransferase